MTEKKITNNTEDHQINISFKLGPNVDDLSLKKIIMWEYWSTQTTNTM